MDSAIGLISIESRSTSVVQPARHSRDFDQLGVRPVETQTTHLAPAVLEVIPAEGTPVANKLRGIKAILLTLQLCLVMFTNSFTVGTTTINVTVMGRDLNLDPTLIYWPVLAYTLTASPLMMPFGSIADVLGAKPVFLFGTLICGSFVLACGFAQDGIELILFRAMQGIGVALVLPTGMAIVASAMDAGRMRNFALAFLGLGMVVGYATGLVLGGVFVSTIGWRFGFWLCGGFQLLLFAFGFFIIPPTKTKLSEGATVSGSLWKSVDWVGSAISCASIGMLSYVLAMISEDSGALKQPANSVLLSLSLLLIPAFGFWMSYQEGRGKPALIPNSLWKTTFVSLCVMVAFTYAEMQCMELLTSFFFQNVQQLSPLETSIRLLPGLAVGGALNLITGTLIHKISVPHLISALSLVASSSPLIMAFVNPSWPYWYEAFPAQVLYPVCVDAIFVAGALIVSEVFPERDQALAGAVFNTIANLGQAIGLAVIAVISNTVSAQQADPTSPSALLEGYRAGYFASFAWMIVTAVVGFTGLRKVGRIGIKRD